MECTAHDECHPSQEMNFRVVTVVKFQNEFHEKLIVLHNILCARMLTLERELPSRLRQRERCQEHS
jgi:hypothetical protein